MEVGERRQHRRLELDLPLTVVQPGSNEPVRARLKDISQGGCFFTVGSAVKADGRITIDFVVLPRAICNATGRVVRTFAGHTDRGRAAGRSRLAAGRGAGQRGIATVGQRRDRRSAASLARARRELRQ